MQEVIRKSLQESANLLHVVADQMSPQIAEVAERAIACLRQGGKIALCGNGGSASQAQHIAGELVGRFRRERQALAALALTTDTGVLTAIGNDYGYEEVFRRQVQGLLEAGDMLISLSTSGNAENVLRAVEQAKSQGIYTVGLTGESGGKLAAVADVCLRVPHSQTSTVQEAHITIGHLLCEAVEVALAE